MCFFVPVASEGYSVEHVFLRNVDEVLAQHLEDLLGSHDTVLIRIQFFNKPRFELLPEYPFQNSFQGELTY